MKRKVLLITTKGCTGCLIIDNILRKALDDYSKEVDYEIQDKDNVDIEFLKAKHINDFPTTILYKGNLIEFMFVGTKPIEVVKRYFDTYFE